jgi:type IV pilus assembly protein PilC
MARFRCKIGLPDGRVVEKDFESFSRTVLKKNLEEQGYCIFHIKRRLSTPWLDLHGGRTRFSGRQFLAFNQEFLVLLKSGLPILDVLDTVAEQLESGAVRAALLEIRESVKGGAALSDSFGRFPRYFPSLYVASLRSGERSGDVPVTLGRYIAYQKRTERIKSRLRSASFYPSLLAVAAVGALFFLLLYVIPTFSQIYADAKLDLPLLTRMMIGFTRLLSDNLLILVPIAVAAGFVLRAFLRSGRGREMLDRAKLSAPFFKYLFRDYALTNFCRTLSTTLSSGIPVITSLEMARGVLNNRVLVRKMGQSVRKVEEGGRLSVAFGESGMFPMAALRMIGVGEKSGALSEMLEEVAEYYEQELERRLDRLTTLIEPLMMASIGLLIGLLVIAMYIPIFQLAGTVR